MAATREIRKSPELARLPIIALTANADADDTARYIAAGMDGVVAGRSQTGRHSSRERLVDEKFHPAERRGSSPSSTTAAA